MRPSQNARPVREIRPKAGRLHSFGSLKMDHVTQLISEAGLCERSHFSYGFQLLLFSVRLTRTVWLPRSFNQWRTDVAGMDPNFVVACVVL